MPLRALIAADRSPFAAPDERGWRLWRAAAEAMGACGVLFSTYAILSVRPGSLGIWTDFAVGVVSLLLLLVRRRFPAGSLLGLAVLMGVLPSVGLLTAVVAYTSAWRLRHARRRAILLVAAALSTVLVGGATAVELGVGSRQYGLAVGAVLSVTTIIVPGLVGISGGQQVRLVQALRERTAAAEEARRLADSESRIHERSRIAAEMHDLVGHRLSLISLHAGGLEMALQKQAPELRDDAVRVREATRDAMHELRGVLGVLGAVGRDTGTDALTDATGTRSDIEALAEESRGVGIPVDTLWEGPDLDGREARVRRAVHRVVRESLTNVHRYATGAPVTVSVTHTAEQVQVRVRNGTPPEPLAATTGLGTGRGLVGLRERVSLLGGSLDAGALPGSGFAVAAMIPTVPGEVAEADERQLASRPAEVETAGGRTLSCVQQRLAQVVSGLLGLAGVAVMMFVGLMLVEAPRVEPDVPERESIRLGMSREQVEDAVSIDEDAVRAAAYGREPARPEGATSCLYPWSRSAKADGPLPIERYCFRGDTLIAIDRFEVPIIWDPASPSPSPS